MITAQLRVMLYILAALYAVLGAILFTVPGWASAHFAWRISPFVAMTMGGWCLGNAWCALVCARRQRWALVLCACLYLALFGLFEAAVVIAFRERLITANPLAWLYLLAIAATCLFAVVAFTQAWMQRDKLAPAGTKLGSVGIVFVSAFVVFVTAIATYALLAVEGGRGLHGNVFPERISMFTLRAFGAFYLAVALGTAPLLLTRRLNDGLSQGFASYGLLAFITVAALVFIQQFDFVTYPLQTIYLGAYLVVGAVLAVYLLKYGTGDEAASGRK